MKWNRRKKNTIIVWRNVGAARRYSKPSGSGGSGGVDEYRRRHIALCVALQAKTRATMAYEHTAHRMSGWWTQNRSINVATLRPSVADCRSQTATALSATVLQCAILQCYVIVVGYRIYCFIARSRWQCLPCLNSCTLNSFLEYRRSKLGTFNECIIMQRSDVRCRLSLIAGRMHANRPIITPSSNMGHWLV